MEKETFKELTKEELLNKVIAYKSHNSRLCMQIHSKNRQIRNMRLRIAKIRGPLDYLLKCPWSTRGK